MIQKSKLDLARKIGLISWFSDQTLVTTKAVHSQETPKNFALSKLFKLTFKLPNLYPITHVVWSSSGTLIALRLSCKFLKLDSFSIDFPNP